MGRRRREQAAAWLGGGLGRREQAAAWAGGGTRSRRRRGLVRMEGSSEAVKKITQNRCLFVTITQNWNPKSTLRAFFAITAIAKTCRISM